MSQEIVYAGASQRRIKCLDQIPGFAVLAVGGGPEPNTPLVKQIVVTKLHHADSTIGGHDPERQIIVAADTRTELKLNGRYISLCKPLTVEETRHNLAALARQPSPTYRVVSASGYNNGKIGTDAMACTIDLDPARLPWYATPEGFDEYLSAFNRFYSQPPYSTNNMATLQPTDISAGFSLPVFIKLGAVATIDGIPLSQIRESQDATLFSAAMLTVAVGLSPIILHQISPDAIPSIMKWNWLQEVTHHLI